MPFGQQLPSIRRIDNTRNCAIPSTTRTEYTGPPSRFDACALLTLQAKARGTIVSRQDDN